MLRFLFVLIIFPCIGASELCLEGQGLTDSDSKFEKRIADLPLVLRPSIGIVFKIPEDYMLPREKIDCLMANVVFNGKPINFISTSYAFYSFGFEGLEILIRNSDVRAKIRIQRRIQEFKFLKLWEFYSKTYYLEIKYDKEYPYNLRYIMNKYRSTIIEDEAEFPFLSFILT